MEAIKLIEEAVDNGAQLANSCKSLGITDRTYYRWKNLDKSYSSYEDRRAYADHSDPSNKLSPEERQRVLDIVNEERFASMPPCQIVPALADEGEYIASESTIYRILREEKMQNHRGRSQEPGKYGKPTSFCATAPNQVWTWDITYLRAAVKGLFYYLYLIVDVFSRDIVGWEVWEEESADHASDLIRRTCIAQGRLTIEPLVLHSDNGSPMKGATMLETLYALGITPSNSRPRVSNDNPYSESLFKTLKYRPAERHAGKSEEILSHRHDVYEAAKAAHPERWNGRDTRDWTDIKAVYLNPDKTYTETKIEIEAKVS